MKLNISFDKIIGYFTLFWILIFSIISIFTPVITWWIIFLPLIVQLALILFIGGVLVSFYYLIVLSFIIGIYGSNCVKRLTRYFTRDKRSS